mgnify:CR=1 FL=1
MHAKHRRMLHHPASSRTKRVAGERKRQAADLQQRLDAALAAQRHLALQLGRMQAGGGRWSLGGAAGSAVARAQVPVGQPAVGEEPNADAEAQADADARRFALQQEELVTAQEQQRRLHATVQQQAAVMERQATELAALREQLAQRGGGRESAPHPSAPRPGHGLPHAGAMQLGITRPHGCTDDSEAGAAASAAGSASLRLRYLESRSALERSTHSNGKLLRQLDGARREVQALRLKVRQQQQAAELQAGGALPVTGTWQYGGPSTTSWDEAGSTPGSAPDSARQAPQPASSPPATVVLQLRQQLAAAEHQAARLEIELDAAQAKLAVYEQQAQQEAYQAQQVQQARPGSWGQGAAKPPLSWRYSTQPLQPRQVQSVVTEQPSPSSRWCSTAGPSWGGQASSAPSAVLELHLHAAELDDSSLAGPQPLTFLTADVGAATAMTHVLTGERGRGWEQKRGCPGGQSAARRAVWHLAGNECQHQVRPHPVGPLLPVASTTGTEVNTLLQFELGQAPLAELARGGGGALVQLHRCAGGSGGVDYETLASAQVPLGGLLAAPQGEGRLRPRAGRAGVAKQCSLACSLAYFCCTARQVHNSLPCPVFPRRTRSCGAAAAMPVVPRQPSRGQFVVQSGSPGRALLMAAASALLLPSCFPSCCQSHWCLQPQAVEIWHRVSCKSSGRA